MVAEDRTPTRMGFRALAAGFICLVAVSLPSLGYGFIGNLKIGGLQLPCAVACGGDRGIINPRFLGDAVNNIFAAPTIDSFGTRADASVDRAMSALDKVLDGQREKVVADLESLGDRQRDALVSDLADLSAETITDLDEVLTRNIEKLTDQLNQSLGTLQGVLEESAGFLSMNLAPDVHSRAHAGRCCVSRVSHLPSRGDKS